MSSSGRQGLGDSGASSGEAKGEAKLIADLDQLVGNLNGDSIERRREELERQKKIEENKATENETNQQRSEHLQSLVDLAAALEMKHQIQLLEKEADRRLQVAQANESSKRDAVVTAVRAAGQANFDRLRAEELAREKERREASEAANFGSNTSAFKLMGGLGFVSGIGSGLWSLPPLDPAAAAEAGKGILEFLSAHSDQILHVLGDAGVGLVIGLALAGIYALGRNSNFKLSGIASSGSQSDVGPAPMRRAAV